MIKKIFRYEVRLWIALFRWVFRRPLPLPPGTTGFQYAGGVKLILGAFIGASALEIPILHLILPWHTVRMISLFVGGYGLLWMFGLLATMRVHLHLVGPEGLRIRNSITLDLPIAWDDIASVRARPRSLPPGGSTQFEDGVLSLGIGAQTAVDVVLARPLVLPVKKTGGAPVSQVRFHTDTPDELVAAAGAFPRSEVA